MKRVTQLFLVCVLGLTLSACQTTGLRGSSSSSTMIIELPSLPEDAVPLTLVQIPAGEFTMGSDPDAPGTEDNELPAHVVTLQHEFYMGVYEITQAQWLTLMDENPSTQIGDNLPVNRVSRLQAKEFIKRLNGIRNDSRFRLPTEAEWEYSARGNTQTLTWFGNDRSSETLEKYVWYRNNSDGEIHEVGQKPANPFGLYDIHGNVWEWCIDVFAPYPSEPQLDPAGPATGSEYVIRGGSWMARPEYIRAADRGKFPADAQYHTGGFRIVWSEHSPQPRN